MCRSGVRSNRKKLLFFSRGSHFNDIGDFCPAAACTAWGYCRGHSCSSAHTRSISNFWPNIFYPLIISPSPPAWRGSLLCPEILFHWDFHNHLFWILSLERHFLWHWMKIFLPGMTANWIHCAGMFPKFYLTFECLATMRQWLGPRSYLTISGNHWDRVELIPQRAFCQRVTQIWKQFELCPVSRSVTIVVSRVTEDAPAL